jgi:hypothetical protein
MNIVGNGWKYMKVWLKYDDRIYGAVGSGFYETTEFDDQVLVFGRCE